MGGELRTENTERCDLNYAPWSSSTRARAAAAKRGARSVAERPKCPGRPHTLARSSPLQPAAATHRCRCPSALLGPSLYARERRCLIAWVPQRGTLWRRSGTRVNLADPTATGHAGVGCPSLKNRIFAAARLRHVRRDGNGRMMVSSACGNHWASVRPRL